MVNPDTVDVFSQSAQRQSVSLQIALFSPTEHLSFIAAMAGLLMNILNALALENPDEFPDRFPI